MSRYVVGARPFWETDGGACTRIEEEQERLAARGNPRTEIVTIKGELREVRWQLRSARGVRRLDLERTRDALVARQKAIKLRLGEGGGRVSRCGTGLPYVIVGEGCRWVQPAPRCQ